MKIYVAKNGSQLGPYTLTEVQQLRQSGQVLDTDLAWHEGLTDWVPLQQIEGMTAAAASPLPTFPTPGTPLQKPPAPLAARILTALVLFVPLFIFLFFFIWIFSLAICGGIVGAMAGNEHHAHNFNEGVAAGQEAGRAFGRAYGPLLMLLSLLLSLILSALSAWALAFSNLFPWCARK